MTIRPGHTWLTITDAATRVQRSPATIRRWHTRGLITIRLGRVDEHQLLQAQRIIAAATRTRTTAALLQANPEVRTLPTNVADPHPHTT